jgi:hypothetical protein
MFLKKRPLTKRDNVGRKTQDGEEGGIDDDVASLTSTERDLNQEMKSMLISKPRDPSGKISESEYKKRLAAFE